MSGLPQTLNCSGGSVSDRISLPANPTKKEEVYKFTLSAVGSKTVSANVSVDVLGTGPVITGFRATPPTVDSGGGNVTVDADVANASSCKLSVKPAVTGLPKTIECSQGQLSVPLGLPANENATARIYVFSLKATGLSTVTSKTTASVAGTASGPVDYVSGTLSSDTTWSPAQATAYVINTSLYVPSGVTLTIAPGTVIKSLGAGAGDPCNVTINLCVAGTLDAVGTSSQPIIFTSENDNSVGASTGSGTPAPGDWAGISIEPGDPAGSIDLENSVIEYDGGFGIKAGLLVQDPNPTLDNDVVENVVGVDYELDSVGPFDNISDVTGAGSGTPVLDLVAGRVATTTLNDEPIAWLTGLAVYVPSGVTLTIAPGTVIKSLGAGAGDPCNVTINLCVAGTLDAVGTSSQPIIFTSENDNSVGASTGSGTPAPGDWAGIAVGGSVELSHTTVEYAGTGIYFDGTTGYADSSSRIRDSDQAVIATSGVFSFRGTLVDNLAGISACDWLGGCVVDAFYATVNQEDLCGAVTTPTTPLFADNCDLTPNPEDILDSAADDFGTTIETETEACDAGTEAACAALAAATSCINDQVANLSTIYPWMPGSDPVEAEAYADDAVSAVNSYITGVEPLVLDHSAGLESFASDVVSGATGIDALAAAYAGCN